MTGSCLLLQPRDPIPTVERRVGNVTVRAPDYSVPGVAERVEADMREHEASQLHPTLSELLAFRARWP